MANYLSRLRARLGPEKIIHPACRILIENAAGQLLVIERLPENERSALRSLAYYLRYGVIRVG